VTPARLIAPAPPAVGHLAAFQDGLHAALQSFLNGDFVVNGSARSALLRPLHLARCRVPWDLFREAVGALHGLGAPASDVAPQATRLIEEGQRRRALGFADAAVLLSSLYALLDHRLGRLGPGAPRPVDVLRAYDTGVYRERGLWAVARLATYVERTLAPYVRGVYLHGSLSTLDYTDYSDLDDFIVVKRETVLSADALRQCAARCIAAARYLYGHDPLQHHRHYAVTEIDLHWYAATYLPPEVLMFATALFGPTRLWLARRDSSAADRSVASALARDLAGRRLPGRRPLNAYHAKSLVSAVLLYPALWLAAEGRHCYKRFSFARARPAFGSAWRAVELATAVRATWRYRVTPRERVLRGGALDVLRNPVLAQHVMARWSQPTPGWLQAFLREHDFYQLTAEFGERALELLHAGRGGA
jgi:hypothetical protein